MPDDLDEHTPEEIAKGSSDYFLYLEECDSQEVIYTWETLLKGSVMLYDFKESD
jgi:hypothetical protein